MRAFVFLLSLGVSLAQVRTPSVSGLSSGWAKYTVTAIPHGTLACDNASISSAVFTGGGLDDATSGGAYTSTADATYTVVIDATGTPDTFKWKKNAGSFTTGVAITGAAQTLTDGITITFAATTGHTATDQWVITVTDLGCWQVNGTLGADKAAGLTQSVVLFELPANGFVQDYRIKSVTACTGTTTLLTGLGTASSANFYRVSAVTGYDLKAAVSATNLTTSLPVAVGSNTTAAVNVVASLTSTVENIEEVVDGCSFSVWVLWSVLP